MDHNRNGSWPGLRALAPGWLAAGVLALLAVTGLSMASAQGRLAIELNKLENTEASCRAYIVLGNDTGYAFESLRLDLVMFDSDGIVSRRLAVQAAPLAKGKTSVKVFGIDNADCGEIGRVLLNDVLDCEAGGPDAADCLALADPSAAGAVPFIK